MQTLQNWQIEFKKITEKYLAHINWNTAIFREKEIGEIGDALQLEAYNALDTDVSISDWDHYYDSCSVRTDFEYLLREKYEEALIERQNEIINDK